MICPNCDYEHLRPHYYAHPERRYHCWNCGFRFSTVEQLQEVAQHQAFQAAMFSVLKETNRE